MILPATRDHLIDVFRRLRDPDAQELALARQLTQDDAERLADEVLQRSGVACVCLACSGRPAAAAGVMMDGPAFGTAWAVGTDELTQHFLTIHRAVRHAVNDAVARGVDLQAFSWEGHPDGNRWLRALRFEEAQRYASPDSGARFIRFERRAA